MNLPNLSRDSGKGAIEESFILVYSPLLIIVSARSYSRLKQC